MYGLSPETDLSALHGSTLTFLGLGQHHVSTLSGVSPGWDG